MSAYLQHEKCDNNDKLKPKFTAPKNSTGTTHSTSKHKPKPSTSNQVDEGGTDIDDGDYEMPNLGGISELEDEDGGEIGNDKVRLFTY